MYFEHFTTFFFKIDAYFSLKNVYVGLLQIYGPHIREGADIRRGQLNGRIVVYEFKGANIREGRTFRSLRYNMIGESVLFNTPTKFFRSSLVLS